MRLINEEEILNDWLPMLTEKTGIKDQYRLNWMSKMCQFQKIHESANAMMNESYTYAAYATLPSTPGMGGVVAPNTIGTPNQFYTGTTGSGDKFPSLLPLSIQIAARTVGFDVVSVIPMNSPVAMLGYIDYVYAGGTISGQVAPILIKFSVNGNTVTSTTFTVGSLYWAINQSALNASARAIQLGYTGLSRIDGLPMFRVGSKSSYANNASWVSDTTITVATVLDGTTIIVDDNSGAPNTTFGGGAALTTTASAQLVNAIEDNITGFTGAGETDTANWFGSWADGTQPVEGMLRETGEQTYYRPLGIKLFSKFVEAKTDQVDILVTQEMITDLNKQWGIDVTSMVENALVNEISQKINKSILSRLFALGWTNNAQLYATEGVTFNFTLDRNNLNGGNAQYIDQTDSLKTIPYLGWQDYGDFENQATVQRRIKSKVLAAQMIINQRGRKGPGTFVVTNAQIATALVDNANYTFAPLANNISDGKGMFPIGTVNGMPVYVDPNMRWADNRICVGRKGADDEPGLKFATYLLSEVIQTISEGTMGPKIAVKSRYALVEAGHYPQLQYYTIHCDLGSLGTIV